MDDNTIILLQGNSDFINAVNLEQGISSGITFANGKFGECFDVPSITSEVKLSNRPEYQIQNVWTIDYWIYAKGKNAVENSILQKGYYTSGVNRGFVLRYITSARNGLELWGSNGTSIYAQIDNTGVQMNVGVWEHVAIVSTGSNVKIYVNGVQKASKNITIYLDGSTRDYQFFTQSNALIDEMRISNIARWTENFIPPDAPYIEDDPDMPVRVTNFNNQASARVVALSWDEITDERCGGIKIIRSTTHTPSLEQGEVLLDTLDTTITSFIDARSPYGIVNYSIYAMKLDGTDGARSTTTVKIVQKIRFIRNRMSGSNKNAGNHWVEVKAWLSDGTNVALGKTSTIVEGTSEGQSLTRITDNDINSANYVGISSGANGVGVLQVDLGDFYEVENVQIWHYYSDSRIYYGQVLEVYTELGLWETLWDDIVDGTYTETSAGKIFSSIITPPFDVAYLIEDQTTGSIFTFVGDMVEQIMIDETTAAIKDDLCEALFIEHGAFTHPSSEVLLQLCNPRVYYWQSSEEFALPRLKAQVVAIPPIQHLFHKVDIEDVTILGIDHITSIYTGSPKVSFSKDEGVSWQAFDGTNWGDGMMYVYNAIALLDGGIFHTWLQEEKKFIIRITLSEHDSLTDFSVHFRN